MKLKTKILLLAGGGTLLAFAGAQSWLVNRSLATANDLALSVAQAKASAKVSNLRTRLERYLQLAIDLGQVQEAFESIEKSNRRKVLTQQIRNMVAENRNILGLWSAWKPNAVDGEDEKHKAELGADASGRFSGYVTWNDSGTLDLETGTAWEEEGVASYFLEPQKLGRPTFLEPYWDSASGKPTLMSSFAVPLKHGDSTVGAAGVDISVDYLQKSVLSLLEGSAGHAALYTAKGMAVAHSDTSLLLKSLGSGTDAQFMQILTDALASTSETDHYYTDKKLGKMAMLCLPLQMSGLPERWLLRVDLPLQGLGPVKRLREVALFSSVMGLLILGLVLWLAWRDVQRNITLLTRESRKVAASVAQGRLSTKVDLGGVAPEFLPVMESYAASIAIVLEPLELATRAIGQLGEGRVPSRIEKEWQGELGAFALGLNRCADLAEIRIEKEKQEKALLALVSEQARNLAAYAVELETVGESLESHAGETLQATEALGITAATVGSASGEARQVAGEGNQSADKTKSLIYGLNENVMEIEEVVHLIQGIAKQTQLLALNATIESARAGEMGKGFAVVASEVKALSQKTQDATSGIEAKVKNIRLSVEQGGQSLNEVVRLMDRILYLQNQVNAAVSGNEDRNPSNESSSYMLRDIERVASRARSTQEGIIKTREAAKKLSAVATQFETLMKNQAKG